MTSQPTMYNFETRPPQAAGDVSYLPEVASEITRLQDKNPSIAQMHARNFGRSAAIDMSSEAGDLGPDTIREITGPLAETFSPGLGSFFKSGVEDVLAMTVEDAAALKEARS